jgi:hypothetical protein
MYQNYSEGDEIYLIGFSRGAFTARSIGGLISSVGLLTKKGLSSFYPIFRDWEHQNNPNFKRVLETSSLPLDRPSLKVGDDTYFKYLSERDLSRKSIPVIKAIGVWDTVGTLGVPTMKLLGIPLHVGSTLEYSFVNTQVAPNVENAYQALALDEKRTPFQPTVWETPRKDSNSKLKVLKQTWFPGVHTSIGGGYADTSISDITLAWMITQLSAHLQFDPDYIPRQQKLNAEFYGTIPVPIREWALGLIPRSDKGLLNTMSSRSLRTPGEYHATSPETGKKLPQTLVETHEFIHPSVRYRRDEGGQAVVDNKEDYSSRAVYVPDAITDWKYLEGDAAVKVAGEKWRGYGVWLTPHGTFIVEEKIKDGTPEMDLITGWPGVEEKLFP